MKLTIIIVISMLTMSASYAAELTGEVCASQILVISEQEAAQLRERVMAYEDAKRGMAFSDLAKLNSIDAESRVNGGNLGCFDRGAIDSAFDDAAFSLAVGEVSQPIHTQFGWHLIFVTEKRAKPDAITVLAESLSAKIGKDWQYIAVGKDMVVFLNAKSIRREKGGLLSAWFFNGYLEPQDSSYVGKKYLSSRFLLLVDCERGALGTKSFTYFGDQFGGGDTVEITSYKESFARESIDRVAPGTTGEMMVKSACAHGSKVRR